MKKPTEELLMVGILVLGALWVSCFIVAVIQQYHIGLEAEETLHVPVLRDEFGRRSYDEEIRSRYIHLHGRCVRPRCRTDI